MDEDIINEILRRPSDPYTFHEAARRYVSDYPVFPQYDSFRTLRADPQTIVFPGGRIQKGFRTQRGLIWPNPQYQKGPDWPCKEKLEQFILMLDESLWIYTGLDLYAIERFDEEYKFLLVFRDKKLSDGLEKVDPTDSQIEKKRGIYVPVSYSTMISTDLFSLFSGIITQIREHLTVKSDEMMENGDPRGELIALELLRKSHG